MTTLEDFLRPSQEKLFKKLCKRFKGNTLINKGNFILVKGVAPVMLVAHLDTVHQQQVRQICAADNGNILSSPQVIGGDDRCGCYALVKVYNLSTAKPWLLFTCNEEIGGLGANFFCLSHAQGLLPNELDTLKFIVEIDRRGNNDAVFYDCYNPNFEAYISSKGFQTAFGSFSDISLIAPELGIAAVNLSAGYHNPHRLNEYIVRSELEHTIEKVVEIVADSNSDNFPRYEYDTAFSFDYDDYFSWQDEGIIIPADLPKEYHDIYPELLEVYSVEQLEEIRLKYGNHILYRLYFDEFSSYYFDR